MFAEFVVVVVKEEGGVWVQRELFSTDEGEVVGGRGWGSAKGTGDCSTIILISCAERLHARLIASRGIFNKYFIRRGIITA